MFLQFYHFVSVLRLSLPSDRFILSNCKYFLLLGTTITFAYWNVTINLEIFPPLSTGFRPSLSGLWKLLHQEPVHADPGQLEPAHLQRPRSQDGPRRESHPQLQLDVWVGGCVVHCCWHLFVHFEESMSQNENKFMFSSSNWATFHICHYKVDIVVVFPAYSGSLWWCWSRITPSGCVIGTLNRVSSFVTQEVILYAPVSVTWSLS